MLLSKHPHERRLAILCIIRRVMVEISRWHPGDPVQISQFYQAIAFFVDVRFGLDNKP